MSKPKTPVLGILQSYTLRENGKLNESQHYLYLYVSFRSNKNGKWTGTLGRLARMLDCPVITLRKRLEKLSKTGLLAWTGSRQGITIHVKKTTGGDTSGSGAGGAGNKRKDKAARKPIEMPASTPLLDPALEVASSFAEKGGEMFSHFLEAKQFALNLLNETDQLHKQDKVEAFLVNGFDRDFGWDKLTIETYIRNSCY